MTLIDDTYGSITLPGPIAVRASTGDIFWSEKHTDNRAILKADKNGQNVATLLTLNAVVVSGLAFIDNVLYFTDSTNGYIKKVDVTSSLGSTPTIVADNLAGIKGIEAVDDNTSISKFIKSICRMLFVYRRSWLLAFK